MRLGGLWAAALAVTLALVGVSCVAPGGVAAAQQPHAPDPANWRPLDPDNTLYIDTVHGRIVIEMFPEVAPNHVNRIKQLARAGFYDGIIFHRVITGFMAQTGDPLGTGEGSSSLPDLQAEFTFRRGPNMPFIEAAHQTNARIGFYKTLPIETQPDAQMALSRFNSVVSSADHCAGVVSMARMGADPQTGVDQVNSANSQFFIVLAPHHDLDRLYSVWGRVVWGQDAVNQIAVGSPPAHPDHMLAVRVAADLPESERAPIYVLRTDGPQFRQLIDQTRARKGADFSICDVVIPARVPNQNDRERHWWSIIPFIP
jgi:peptidylprolyl isomerase